MRHQTDSFMGRYFWSQRYPKTNCGTIAVLLQNTWDFLYSGVKMGNFKKKVLRASFLSRIAFQKQKDQSRSRLLFLFFSYYLLSFSLSFPRCWGQTNCSCQKSKLITSRGFLTLCRMRRVKGFMPLCTKAHWGHNTA